MNMQRIINFLIIAISIILIIHLTLKYKKSEDKRSNKLPNLVSTVGVLGTFLGITISLWSFDANNIDLSVPKLLGGMNTAFITSVTGMGASLYMKYIQWKNESTLNEEEKVEDGVDLIKLMINEMKHLNTTLVANQHQTNNLFVTMDEKWSMQQKELLREIQDLNSSLNNKQDKLIVEFKSFAHTMAEQNSQSLIDALNEVIKDFNEKITEQFGENFKELNKAVGALLVWQDNYKEHVETTIEQLKVTTNSMIQIEGSMNNISDKSQVLIETSDRLNGSLNLIHNNQTNIENNMNSLVEVGENAKNLIPSINEYFEITNRSINHLMNNVDGTISDSMSKLENHVEQLTLDVGQEVVNLFKEMKDKVEDGNNLVDDKVNIYLQKFNKIVDELNNCIPEISETIESSTKNFNQVLLTFKDEIGKSIDRNISILETQGKLTEESTLKISENLENTTRDLNSRIEDITVNTSEQIKKLVEEMEKVFEQKVEQLDKLLQKELTDSLESLGTQLATISDHFVKDYTPLTNRLKDIVTLAERISA